MGTSTASNYYEQIGSLESRIAEQRRRADRWRTVAWVAMFILAVLTFVVL